MSALSSQVEELDAKSSTAERSAKGLQEQLHELQVGSSEIVLLHVHVALLILFRNNCPRRRG